MILRLAPCKVHSRRSLDFVGVETVDGSQVVGHIQAHHIYYTSTSHYTTIHFKFFFLSDRKKGNIVIYDSERLRGHHVNHATLGGRFKCGYGGDNRIQWTKGWLLRLLAYL